METGVKIQKTHFQTLKFQDFEFDTTDFCICFNRAIEIIRNADFKFYKLTRLQQLQEFLDEDPNDPFNVYALAIEYQKSDVLKSIELFQQLIKDSPTYVPTYYHFGKTLQEIGKTENAKTVFETGIHYAQQLNEAKALRELRAALLELEDGF